MGEVQVHHTVWPSMKLVSQGSPGSCVACASETIGVVTGRPVSSVRLLKESLVGCAHRLSAPAAQKSDTAPSKNKPFFNARFIGIEIEWIRDLTVLISISSRGE